MWAYGEFMYNMYVWMPKEATGHGITWNWSYKLQSAASRVRCVLGTEPQTTKHS